MDVKWIKVKVGMFDGESFKRIKRAKIGGEKYRDKLTAVWFELMDLAAKCNHGGQFINSREIPYKSIEDIAIMIDRDTDELELCMEFYINDGMVEIIDDVYSLSNWSEYQNEEKLEKIREQKRVSQAKWRANKALVESTVESTDTSTEHLPSTVEEEREKEREYSSSSSIARGDEKVLERRSLHPFGDGGVMLSEDQIEDLTERLTTEEFDHYVSVIEECIAKGKPYKRKSHYQAILDMATKDRKVIK